MIGYTTKKRHQQERAPYMKLSTILANKTQLPIAMLLLPMTALVSITILTGTILSSSIVSATNDSVVDQVNITVPVSCTMTGTGMDSHSTEIENGLYENNIGTTTLHAFCNDNEGFAIYAAGYTGNEIGGTNSNKLVGTNASSNATIVSGTATTAGNPDISNWAMKLAISQDSGDTTGTNAFTIDSAPNVSLPSQAEPGATSTSFSNYHMVPNEYTKVAHKNSNTDMTTSTGGVKLTTTYAAYISKTQPADTYTGQVIYTLVHPANHVAPGRLDPNVDNISRLTYMQEFAVVSDEDRRAIINSMTLERQYTVTDIRDNKTYTISKLADGNVWMTQNLDLDIDATRTYTNEDTDLGYNNSTGEYDTASWTPTRSTYEATSTQIHAWCQGGTWDSEEYECVNNYTPESYDPGELYWNGIESDNTVWNRYGSSCDYSTSPLVCDQSMNPINAYVSSTGIQQYHLGNYYNWTAAIAMNDGSSYDIDEHNEVNQSICPAGWALPRRNSFTLLWDQVYGFRSHSYNDANNNHIHDANEDALWTSPLYFVAGGLFSVDLWNVGHYGGFWISDPSFNVALFDVYGLSQRSMDQTIGRSIRCVLRPVFRMPA